LQVIISFAMSINCQLVWRSLNEDGSIASFGGEPMHLDFLRDQIWVPALIKEAKRIGTVSDRSTIILAGNLQ